MLFFFFKPVALYLLLLLRKIYDVLAMKLNPNCVFFSFARKEAPLKWEAALCHESCARSLMITWHFYGTSRSSGKLRTSTAGGRKSEWFSRLPFSFQSSYPPPIIRQTLLICLETYWWETYVLEKLFCLTKVKQCWKGATVGNMRAVYQHGRSLAWAFYS